jgi:hypothetical protein
MTGKEKANVELIMSDEPVDRKEILKVFTWEALLNVLEDKGTVSPKVRRETIKVKVTKDGLVFLGKKVG